MVPSLAFIALLLVALAWMRHARRKRSAGTSSRTRLMPEALVRVGFDDAEIICSYPDGAFRKVGWPELAQVQVRTTSDGPRMTDVFWDIHTRDRHPAIVFPGGALGESELLQALQQRLSRFDNNALVQAMASASDRTFVLWRAAT